MSKKKTGDFAFEKWHAALKLLEARALTVDASEAIRDAKSDRNSVNQAATKSRGRMSGFKLRSTSFARGRHRRRHSYKRDSDTGRHSYKRDSDAAAFLA